MNPLDQKINHLPTNPGVYLFKDRNGTVLYIGKAGSIKHRVRSYFQKPAEKGTKTSVMLEKVADVETIVTSTEKEALILEDTLVKEHHPRYNVKLRDDKRYPCLRLSIEEEFPTLRIVRRIKKDRSLYFGPYPSATSLKETLKLIRRLFPIRTCLDTKFSNRLRPCINYEMGRCLGPCCGEVTPSQYREVIQQVKMFLEGRDKELIQKLKKKMEEESEQLHFEAAAKIRDQIEHIEHVIEKQRVVSSDFVDQDVIGVHTTDHTMVIHSLFIRAGKLLGGKGFTFSSTALPEVELLSSFLHQYYREGQFIPEQVLIPITLPDQPFLEQWLTEQKGRRVQVSVPVKGEKRRLLDLACENAKKFLARQTELELDQEKLLKTLKEKLHLAKVPRRIEAFDISNLHGGDAVGSMVVFEDGKFQKDRYRHFKIRTVEGSDDTGMMYEVLLRRYRKALLEHDLPDLVLLDGGRGQLNMAREVFRELKVEGVDLLSLAKERTVGRGPSPNVVRTGEKVFHPQFKEPFILGKHSQFLLFLDRIRDEVHRFAITYHKKIRSRGARKSVLEEIPGIGRVRQRELLKFFGSLEEVEQATPEELMKVPKMDRGSSQKVFDFFHPTQK